jgi:RHS repeat-associated protein
VNYLHSDHLGSVGVTTNQAGTVVSRQYFGPWGKLRAGGIGQTSLNYTGQRLDITGLLYYHARMYDPALGRFISADSVVPGNASGGMEGIALKPLTVDFHEPGFVGGLNQENRQPFWFQMTDEQRQEAPVPWGPQNPQALNRYSYVQNNALRYTDPTGHFGVSSGYGTVTYHLTHDEARFLWDIISSSASTIAGVVDAVLTGALSMAANSLPLFLMEKFGLDLGGALLLGAQISSLAAAGATVGTIMLAVSVLGIGLAAIDGWYGNQGVDITVYNGSFNTMTFSAPTVARQQGVWIDDKQVCKVVDAWCYGDILLGVPPH